MHFFQQFVEIVVVMAFVPVLICALVPVDKYHLSVDQSQVRTYNICSSFSFVFNCSFINDHFSKIRNLLNKYIRQYNHYTIQLYDLYFRISLSLSAFYVSNTCMQ